MTTPAAPAAKAPRPKTGASRTGATTTGPGKDPLARLSRTGTLLVFGATWCGPWLLLAPLLDELAATGVDVRRVDVDVWPQHAEAFRVLPLPTLVWMRDGKERRRHTGAISARELSSFTSRT